MDAESKIDELKAKMKKMERATIEQMREMGYYVDMQSRAQWIDKIIKIDGVSREEAYRMVVEEPQYSLSWKMCGCPIIKIALQKKQIDKFREILTPEEDKIFTEEVLKLNLSKIVKRQIKKQNKKVKA